MFGYLYPANIFMRDDLPAPDGPIMAVSSSERNSPDIDFRMVFGPGENEKF